jgi:YD repeat-containing protein
LLAATIPPLNNRTTYQYDGAHRQIAVTNGAVETTQSRYNANGTLLTTILPKLNRTTYLYDGANRPIRVINGVNRPTDSRYYLNGLLLDNWGERHIICWWT